MSVSDESASFVVLCSGEDSYEFVDKGDIGGEEEDVLSVELDLEYGSVLQLGVHSEECVVQETQSEVHAPFDKPQEDHVQVVKESYSTSYAPEVSSSRNTGRKRTAFDKVLRSFCFCMDDIDLQSKGI